MKYKCPLCGSTLSESHFHRVVKLQEKKEKVQKGELAKLRKAATLAQERATAVKRSLAKARADAKTKVAAAKKDAADLERRKSVIRNKRLLARIQKLEEEKKMLAKHTSPQQIGLADELVLVKALRREFPEDGIQHTGKGGDVLQFVRFKNEKAGCIVYECKHTDRIAESHVAQTANAKKTRHADYAILVTTGTRRHFSGLDQESGVFIVSQSGALPLAGICRESLVAMAKQRLDDAARAAAARRLMDYVTSPICKTPMEEAISYTERAQENLLREIKAHTKEWKDRYQIYQTIHYDVSHVKANIARVINGDAPLKLERPKLEPLALPVRSD